MKFSESEFETFDDIFGFQMNGIMDKVVTLFLDGNISKKEYNKQIKMLSDIGYQVETAEELLKFDE